jgi:Dolichyl-phosphate-mannose-protein mannosyltransferase
MPLPENDLAIQGVSRPIVGGSGGRVKEALAPLLAIGGALLALGGTIDIHRAPIAGPVAIVAGLAAFFAGAGLQREVSRSSAVPIRVSESDWPIAGLPLLASASFAAIVGWSDRIVLALWLSGILAVGLGFMASRWRLVRRASIGRGRERVAVVSLLVVAAAVNLYRLADFPPSVHGDVGEIALLALSMDVARDVFRPSSWWGIPGMHNALARLGLLVADGLAGARLTDALLGVVAVLPLMAVVREAAGFRAALVTASLAIGSASMVNTWRSGLGLGPPPLLALLALWAFLRAMRSADSPRDFFLFAGLVAGLSVQVNLAARIIPVILVAFAAHELALGSNVSRRRMLSGFYSTVVGAVLVAGPLLWHYTQAPERLQPRAEKFILSESSLRAAEETYGVNSALGVVWNQLVRSFGMFHCYRDGERAGFFIVERSFFEPLTAALLLLGVAVAIPRLRERRFAWPVIGWVLSVLLIASTVRAPGFHRAGPAAAFALVIVGFGCEALLGSIEQLCTALRSSRRIARMSANLTAVAIAAIGLAWGTSVYFLDYGRREWDHTNSTEIAKRIAAEPIDGSFTYALTTPDFYFDYGNIRFIAHGHKGKDLLPGSPPPTADELAPGVDLFVALPGRAAELRLLARKLPPGTFEEHYKRPPWDPGQLEFLVLRIVKPRAAAS